MHLRLNGNRVLVRQDKADDKTSSGILLRSDDKSKECYGTVASVAEGFNHIIKEGDRVIYEKYAGAEIDLDSESYLIMSIDDIIAVISE